MKKALIRVALVAGGLVVVEVAWRAVLFASGDGYDGARTRAAVAELVREIGAAPERNEDAGDLAEARSPVQRFLHPYFGFESREGHEQTRWQVEYSRGAGAESAALPFTVLVVGGSQARIFADPGPNGGVDALVSTLAAGMPDLGRPIGVLGHGREAFKQPQQVMLVAYLFTLGLRPDAVVNLDGFNELALGMVNRDEGLDPLFPSQPHWAHLLGRESTSGRQGRLWEDALVERARARHAAELSPFLFSSAVVGTAIRRYAANRVAAFHASLRPIPGASEDAGASSDTVPPVTSGLRLEVDDDAALDLLVDNWIESSLSLHALCAARDITYLHVLQPTLHDEGSKPLTDDERREGATFPVVEQAIRRGYPRLRAAISRLTVNGLHVLDASDLFRDVSERVYHDLCHFNRPGTELLGAAIGRALLELEPGATSPPQASQYAPGR
jgi:hypothetical protein